MVCQMRPPRCRHRNKTNRRLCLDGEMFRFFRSSLLGDSKGCWLSTHRGQEGLVVVEAAMARWPRSRVVGGSQHPPRALDCFRDSSSAHALLCDRMWMHRRASVLGRLRMNDHRDRCMRCSDPREERGRSRRCGDRTAMEARFACTLGGP